MFALSSSFELFIQECQFVKSLSPNTIVSYRKSYSNVAPHLAAEYGDPCLLRADLKQAIITLNSSGARSPAGMNIVIRSLNAWLHWAHKEGMLSLRIAIPRVKEPTLELEVLTDRNVADWIHYKPERGLQTTVHMMVLLMLDAGLRVQEAQDLKHKDVNWQDQLVTVIGKGRKQRTIPFSADLRRVWFKYSRPQSRDVSSDEYAFASRAGTRLDYQNIYREYKVINAKLGITVRKGFHTLRHTFGTSFIRRGGDVFMLQRILGHTALSTTQRYVNLVTSDLALKHKLHARLLSL
jgi:integrase/recombinase XerD